jgi:integrase
MGTSALQTAGPGQPTSHSQQSGAGTVRHILPAVRTAGLEPLRFHDLRHTTVALLIAQGAHAKEIAERLGHSTVRLTLDRYGHLLPSLDERLRDGLEATYRAANVAQVWTSGGPSPTPAAHQGAG